jgi:hypothetical protein
LEAALQALGDGHKMVGVSRHYKIPETLARDHVNERTKSIKICGSRNTYKK